MRVYTRVRIRTNHHTGPPDMAMHDGNMIVLHSEPTITFNGIEIKVTLLVVREDISLYLSF